MVSFKVHKNFETQSLTLVSDLAKKYYGTISSSVKGFTSVTIEDGVHEKNVRSVPLYSRYKGEEFRVTRHCYHCHRVTEDLNLIFPTTLKTNQRGSCEREL